MLSPKEKEIVERCLAVSIWNHRMGKSNMKGNLVESEVFEERIRAELTRLERLVINLNCPREVKITPDPSEDGMIVGGKKDGFFKQFFFGRFGRGKEIR